MPFTMPLPEFFFFDLGNVLLFFDHERAVENLARLTGCPPYSLREAIFQSGLEDQYERGELSSQEFLRAIEQALGIAIPFQPALDAASDIFTENRAMLGPLRRAKALGIRLGILSNTCDAHWNWILRQRYEVLEGWFEFAVLSFEEHSMKPDRTIYEAAATRANLASSEKILFIDDRPDNVEGARRVGWHAEVFADVKQLDAWLDVWEASQFVEHRKLS